MSKICVIGSGSWGTALSCLLHTNGHNVSIWSFSQGEVNEILETRENKNYLPNIKIPKEIQITTNIEKAIENAEIIVCAVPSKFIRETLTKFVPFFKQGQIIVNVAKGLEESTLKSLCEVIEELAPTCFVTALSGPSHAEEVAKGIPTTVVASSKNMEIAKKVQDVFMNDNFRVYVNDDITGVELGGALKNVIALAAGISDGLGFGDNTKAALMTRGLTEITRLGVALGGREDTFSGLTGIGDLIVTCTSMHSRNRRCGILLGQGKTLEQAKAEVKMVVEGVNTAKAASELAKKYNVEMPIITEINKVLFEDKNAKQAVIDLMTRDKKIEHADENAILYHKGKC